MWFLPYGKDCLLLKRGIERNPDPERNQPPCHISLWRRAPGGTAGFYILLIHRIALLRCFGPYILQCRLWEYGNEVKPEEKRREKCPCRSYNFRCRILVNGIMELVLHGGKKHLCHLVQWVIVRGCGIYVRNLLISIDITNSTKWDMSGRMDC